MSPIELLKGTIESFGGVAWVSAGYPLEGQKGEPPADAGWVKFGLKKSELGWRTLEFLAWVFTDMSRAGERVAFFPTAPPPYLNTPGSCLSFVIECHALDGDGDVRFRRVAEFVASCREDYWPACRGRLSE